MGEIEEETFKGSFLGDMIAFLGDVTMFLGDVTILLGDAITFLGVIFVGVVKGNLLLKFSSASL